MLSVMMSVECVAFGAVEGRRENAGITRQARKIMKAVRGHYNFQQQA